MAGTAPTPLVGRVDELRTLAELLGVSDPPRSGVGDPARSGVGDPARSGVGDPPRSGVGDPPRSGVVLLGGDAGAGKSRLVGELAASGELSGWRVLLGHCLDFGDASPPYLPFSEALGRLPAAGDGAVALDPLITRLLPGVRWHPDRDTDAEPEAEPARRSAVYDAVHATLRGLGEAGPLLLVIEDLHWADGSTRDLLRFLFTRGFEVPVAVLATYRSDDLHRRHPLRAALAEWVRLPSVARLQLGPLPDDEARELLTALGDGELGESDRRRILSRAEGNPFFIEELVAASAVTGGELPADLADLLLVRLDRVSDDARLVVRAAAVAGRQVSHQLLAQGTDLLPAALEAALREAVEANLLVRTGADGYGFRHALLGEATYQDLLPGERTRLHAAFAAALAVSGGAGSAAELARHARASHDLATATRASIAAGDEAMRVGGPEEASRHYEHALELLADPGVAAALGADDPDSLDRLGLVIRASNATAAAGHPFRALALAEDALTGLPGDAPPVDRVRLIHALVRIGLYLDAPIDLLGLTSEALMLLADSPPSLLRAQVLVVHARASADRARDAEAARWAGEALAMANELDLPEVASDATILLARLDERAGDPGRAEAAITAAIAASAAAGEPMAELRGLHSLATLHYGQGRLASAVALFQQAVARARVLGRPWAQYGLDAAMIGAIVAHVSGDWTAAEQLIDSVGPRPPEHAEMMLAAMRLELAAGRGDVAALRDLPRLSSWWRRDGLVAITSGGAAIELFGQTGDVDAAISAYDDVVAAVREIWMVEDFYAGVRLAGLLLGQLASSAAVAPASQRQELLRRGDDAAARAATTSAGMRHIGPEGRAWSSRVVAEQARLHWLAGIDPTGEAVPTEAVLIEKWQQAVADFETFGHRYETARSQARLAAVLLAAGQPERAGPLLAAARSTAVELGAATLLAELHALTGATDSSPREHRSRASETLTPREHEVLTLVATGRSNRAIAQQLFISAKTVSVHISNLLAKLDAASRTEAVAIARRRSLID